MRLAVIFALIILVSGCTDKPTAVIEEDCNKLENDINALLDQANYCNMDSDCVVSTGFQCPFGCYNLVNKNSDLTEIKELEDRYYNKDCTLCVYSCIFPPNQEEIKCKDNKCVDVRFESTTELDNRCKLLPESGPCKARFTRYYFDQVERVCKTFTWGGCDGVVPFNTLEECREACEK